MWAGTQRSPSCYPPLEITQAFQKELGNRQAKLLLFRSTVIQILKLAGDQLLNPENYTSVISKWDKSLGTDTGILINRVKAVFISTSFQTKGFLCLSPLKPQRTPVSTSTEATLPTQMMPVEKVPTPQSLSTLH